MKDDNWLSSYCWVGCGCDLITCGGAVPPLPYCLCIVSLLCFLGLPISRFDFDELTFVSKKLSYFSMTSGALRYLLQLIACSCQQLPKPDHGQRSDGYAVDVVWSCWWRSRLPELGPPYIPFWPLRAWSKWLPPYLSSSTARLRVSISGTAGVVISWMPDWPFSYPIRNNY